MKNIVSKIVAVVLLLTGIISCSNKGESISDVEIDIEDIMGTWEVFEFAHTANGNKISSVHDLPPFLVTFTETPPFYLEDEVLKSDFFMGFKVCNYALSQASNGTRFMIDMHHCDLTLFVGWTDDCIEIDKSLSNAYSFAIKDEQLFIHFKGSKNKNLLILNRVAQ
jgi:hypothetical protein